MNDEELYEAIGRIAAGQDLGDVLKATLFMAGGCASEMSDGIYDDELITDIKLMLGNIYEELCTDNIALQ